MAEPTTVNSQITDAVAPETSAAPVGRFVWHDLMTTDVEKAQKYYADLVGWTYKGFDMGGEMGTYSMIHAGGTEWGGFVHLDPSHGIPSHWMSYVTVPDVDAVVAKAHEVGGKAPVPGTDIPSVGRFAVLESPTGAYISPYKSESSGEMPEPQPAPGTFVWHELLAKDPQAEGKFHAELFGWRIEEVPMEGMTYYLFKRLDSGQDAGGMLQKPPHDQAPSSWLPYIQVESADAIAARTEELGGKVWVQPRDIPGVGRFTVTSDPTGAFIAFLQPAQG